jgi:hypothetical protein
MAKLIYSGITSLDGYLADVDGNFDWAVPDEHVPDRRERLLLGRALTHRSLLFAGMADDDTRPGRF